jgi:hypothetical protein
VENEIALVVKEVDPTVEEVAPAVEEVVPPLGESRMVAAHMFSLTVAP